MIFNDLAYKFLDDAYSILLHVIGLSDKITQMTMKIVVSPEYDYEKRHFHSNRLILILLQKELTALSDAFLNFGGYAPDWLHLSTEYTRQF